MSQSPKSNSSNIDGEPSTSRSEERGVTFENRDYKTAQSSSASHRPSRETSRRSRLIFLGLALLLNLLTITWEIVDHFDLLESGANVMLIDPNFLWASTASISCNTILILSLIFLERRVENALAHAKENPKDNHSLLTTRYYGWIFISIGHFLVTGMLAFKAVLTIFACISAAVLAAKSISSDTKVQIEESCAVLLAFVVSLLVGWVPASWRTISETHSLRPSIYEQDLPLLMN